MCHIHFKQLKTLLDVTRSNGFLQPLASSYEALYRHYNSGGEPIYEEGEMEQFAHTHAPTLFTQLLNSITNRDSAQSKERLELQRKGTVTLLHIII